jgi:hypothetical protein
LLGALVVILAKEYNKKVPSESDKEVDSMGIGEAEAEEDEGGEEDE